MEGEFTWRPEVWKVSRQKEARHLLRVIGDVIGYLNNLFCI